MRRWMMALALLLLFCGVANATDAPPNPEFSAKRWTGTRWKTLTSSNARLVAYHKITTAVADTATADQVVCTYLSSSAIWRFEATVTGTWWVFDQACNPDSLVIGTFGLFCVASGGVGSGSGDLTGIGVRSGGLSPNYLHITGDSLSGNPLLWLNINGSGSSLDIRYLNDAVNEITGGRLADESVDIKDIATTLAAGAYPTDGYILSYSAANSEGKWVSPNSGTSGVTSVTSANSYIAVATGTTTPLLTFDATQLNAGFVQQTTESTPVVLLNTLSAPGLRSTAQGLQGDVGVYSGNTSTASKLFMSDGSNNWTAVGSAPLLNADWSLILPVTGTNNAGRLLAAANGSSTATTTLEWVAAGSGIVNDITAGNGILITNHGTSNPTIAADMEGALKTRFFDAVGDSSAVIMGATGSITAPIIISTSSLQAGAPSSQAGDLVVYGSSGKRAELRASTDQTSNILGWRMPHNVGAATNVLMYKDALGNTEWTGSLDMNGAMFSGGVQVGTYVAIEKSTDPAVISKFQASSLQASILTYTLPPSYGVNGSQLTSTSGGVLSWGSAFKRMVPASDTLTYEPSKRGGPPSYLKYYNDLEYTKADSASLISGIQDHSYLSVDTTQVPIKTGPVTLQSTLHVVGPLVCNDFIEGAGFAGLADTGFSVQPDTAWFDGGGRFAHKLLVGGGGTGTHPDRLTVAGQLAVTGTATTAGIANTGNITASTKIAATDSVCGYKSLIAGTPTVDGSDVLWSANGKKLTVTAPTGMAADRALTLFSWAKVDTFKCSTDRYRCGDRSGSKYVAGVLTTDFIVVTGWCGGAASSLVTIPCSDSVSYTWTPAIDNKTPTYLILRTN